MRSGLNQGNFPRSKVMVVIREPHSMTAAPLPKTTPLTAKKISSFVILRQPDFSTPSYNTVTYGKYTLRYVGPKLWGKSSPDVRSAKT